jgi:hypothetical protein
MAMAHYVQSLGAFPHDTASPKALDALSKELASPGEMIPNRIPVSMAMAGLEAEFAALRPLEIKMESRNSGGEILRRVVINRARAARVLTESSHWRAAPSALAAVILPDTPENGFSVCTANLSPADWRSLHAELLSQIRSK